MLHPIVYSDYLAPYVDAVSRSERLLVVQPGGKKKTLVDELFGAHKLVA